ncbi:response regulator transcription factor [Streptomyces sp. NBC_01707]|jgi:DNA-binding NarL/FixJ family response regulator|uniref:response regulator n=1 Tax=unclassified Streptomyces TaxID=2593676 RepID=UPI000885789C|nr:response regulator transcription factor [Streptomyces sp. 136MFCol5.1]SCZ16447.1 DNA-binding response regulator, NarL/FixJ family, contains REC and HTH domains [Streptomyces sp. 136MFCol5.1]
MIRVLLADDDPLVRAGLRMMLGAAEGITVIAEASDGTEVPALVDLHRPDLILMDIRMPIMDGIEATRILRARADAPEIIMLTTLATDGYVLRALQAGASGFLLKHTLPQDLVAALRRAAVGEPVFSPGALRQLVDSVAVRPSGDQAARHSSEGLEQPAGGGRDARGAQELLDRLGAREREVSLAVAEGKTNAQIAGELYLSIPTVKAHVSHILTKLGLNNRVQIALLVYRAGLI